MSIVLYNFIVFKIMYFVNLRKKVDFYTQVSTCNNPDNNPFIHPLKILVQSDLHTKRPM